MKLVFALFDSLNRLSLESYGSQSIKTPNFKRLSERCVTFDKHFVGSLPCMPARRDMQTGRLNFYIEVGGPWNLLIIPSQKYYMMLIYIVI